MRILESERLILKPVEKENLEFLLQLRWDKMIMQHLIHQPLNMQSQLTWFENLQKSGELAFCIFLKDAESSNNKLVGITSLSHFNLTHQRAIWQSCRISEIYQHKGIATEAVILLFDYAFNTLNLNKITGDTFEENNVLRGMAKKLGFKEEGVLRNQHFHNGKYTNSIAIGLLRTDFNDLINK